MSLSRPNDDQSILWNLQELLKEEQNTCAWYAFSLTHNEADAQDLVQTSFLKFIRVFPAAKFTNRVAIRAYLKQIIFRQFLDGLRARKRENEALQDYAYEPRLAAGSPVDVAERMENASLLRKAIELLPVGQAQVARMIYFEFMQVNQIAAAINRPEGTIKRQLQLAREKLKQILDPDFEL